MATASDTPAHDQPQSSADSLGDVGHDLAKGGAVVAASRAILASADELPTEAIENLHCALSAYKRAVDSAVQQIDAVMLKIQGPRG